MKRGSRRRRTRPWSRCIGDGVITAIETNHPGGNLAFRIESKGQSIGDATDTEPRAARLPSPFGEPCEWFEVQGARPMAAQNRAPVARVGARGVRHRQRTVRQCLVW